MDRSTTTILDRISERFISQGEFAEAIVAYREAIEERPDFPEAHNCLGIALQQQGKLDEATAAYRKAVEQNPEFAEAHNNLGFMFQLQHRLDDAVVAYDRAIAIRSGFAEAHNGRGIVLLMQGKTGDAGVAFREAIGVSSDYAEAHANLGLALHATGEPDDAVAACRRAIELRPDFAEAHGNLGLALQAGGRLDEAVVAYRKAIDLKPEYPEAVNSLAMTLQQQGVLDQAITTYRQAIDLRPDYPDAHSNLGWALCQKGRYSEAIDACRQAIALRPDFAVAYNNLGYTMEAQNRLGEALVAYDKAIALRPDYSEAHNNRANVLQNQGRLDEAVAGYRKVLQVRPGYAVAHSNLLMCLCSHANQDATALFAEHRRFAEQQVDPLAATPPAHGNDANPDRRLRIGYVSPDLRFHSVAYFVRDLLAAHDRAGFEAVCYADVLRPDAMTAQLRDLADDWRSILGMNAAAVAQRIREDAIDILVDLTGHMAFNRMLVFARKPAPVQVTYIGYPNTTGIDEMNYRFTDAVADPEGQDAFYRETLLRLPRCFLCYSPPAEAPEPSPAIATRPVTFGSFNHLRKLTPEVVGQWARILLAVPGARLVLKAQQLADATTKARYLAMFGCYGIPIDRLELSGWTASMGEHLDSYRRIDVALDPFPYNGTTTTCEALWMGVPVVALAGDAHAGRVGVSLLTAVGLADLVAASPQDYVAKAVALAGDPGRRAELRTGLRQMMAASPLCDAAGLARAIETEYRTMWRRWCEERNAAP